MITFSSGNLLDCAADALVNTVNTVGVMGKGIALMFKDSFPDNFQAYAEACRRQEIETGRMFVFQRNAILGPRWIINFPTKQHWRQPSQIAWIEQGLQDLRRVIEREQIGSIALPPLGAGNGGLDWTTVRARIETALSDLPGVSIHVFEPTARYQNVAKRSGSRTLTPARALIVQAIHAYEALGFECSLLEVQKLAWFLQTAAADLRLDDPLGLAFRPQRYGPYADGLRHVLEQLDGSYLHCDRRIADARRLDVVRTAPAELDRVTAFLGSGQASRLRPALARTVAIIEGYESPFGLELLATVDWLRRQGTQATVAGMRASIAQWPYDASAAERKARIFDDRVIGLALCRLAEAAPLPA